MQFHDQEGASAATWIEPLFCSEWQLSTAEWAGLIPGDRVRIQMTGKALEVGTIDVMSDDASVFWLWLDQGRGRMVVHRTDNVKVWFHEGLKARETFAS